MGEGGGRRPRPTRRAPQHLGPEGKREGKGGGRRGVGLGWSCSCSPLPGVAHRLVSGAGDIKLTKDGNVLLQEMVSREGGAGSLGLFSSPSPG